MALKKCIVGLNVGCIRKGEARARKKIIPGILLRFRFITSAGVTTNIFIKETSTSIIEYGDGTSDKNSQPTTYDYNRINISPIVSAGIDWKVNSKSNLRIEPVFRYGVLKVIDQSITEYLWNAGLNISYNFGLK